MSKKVNASAVDGRIRMFARVVSTFRGQYWAPEGALPCPRPELFQLLVATREPLRPAEPTYLWLTDLIVDLTRFVPDEDVDEAQPFLAAGGRITRRALGDGAQARQRYRVAVRFQQHHHERDRLLASAGVDAARSPIGRAVWSAIGSPDDRHRAEDGYAPTPESEAPLDDPGSTQAAIFIGWIPGLVAGVICAAALALMGHPSAAVATLIGGPVVGFVACLTLLSGGGKVLLSLKASHHVQEGFLVVALVIGAPVAVALAVAAWVDPRVALAVIGAAVAWTVAVIAYSLAPTPRL